ncbi:MAG: metal-sulfur cluster assembly factor [Candidatus Paceibacterota bacterium]|jgi:metal-sulfur cluster biosynthetic enzyme
MVTKEQIIKALKTVKDPEVGIDLWTLGLIYDIKIAEDGVDILMTLTSPFCPFGNEIVLSVEKVVKELGVEEVRVDITFEPAWQPSDELRTMLGI